MNAISRELPAPDAKCEQESGDYRDGWPLHYSIKLGAFAHISIRGGQNSFLRIDVDTADAGRAATAGTTGLTDFRQGLVDKRSSHRRLLQRGRH